MHNSGIKSLIKLLFVYDQIPVILITFMLALVLLAQLANVSLLTHSTKMMNKVNIIYSLTISMLTSWLNTAFSIQQQVISINALGVKTFYFIKITKCTYYFSVNIQFVH